MSDYRCDHGYYAMGRDCPTCQKERDEARKVRALEEARKERAQDEALALRAEVEREKARADEMKADGERAVLEERNRTAKAAAERDRLAGLLIESNRLLKDAKRHLGPHTTNSDADTAIARNDAALAEVKP